MRKSHYLLGFSLLITMPVFAQEDLVPATSEDIQSFDEQVENSETGEKAQVRERERKQNFGATVSEEAKKFEHTYEETHKNMGQWVSEQRRKNGEKKGQGVGHGSTMGGSADARSSAPSKKPSDSGSSRSNRGR